MKTSVCAIAAAAAFLASAATGLADEHLDRIGGWIVLTSEPSAGNTITQISHTDGAYMIELVCTSGPWSAYIFDSSDRDSGAPMTPVSMSYSLDGGAAKKIPGQGHPRYRFELRRSANAFVSELTHANTLSITIDGGPRATLRVGQTGAAVASSLSRCPL